MAKGKKGVPAIAITAPEEPKGYEGSYEDMRQDWNAADRKGVSREQYEDSAEDRIADKAGEKRMREKEADKAAQPEGPKYTPGQSHHSSTPKISSGFGHKAEQRKGALRCSGHSGAHQIGKRK